MATVVKICNEDGNKLSGFEISEHRTLKKLFEFEEVHAGDTFEVGNYQYEITDIFVQVFSHSSLRETLDNPDARMDVHLWMCCKTNDPRFQPTPIEVQDLESIKDDLGI